MIKGKYFKLTVLVVLAGFVLSGCGLKQGNTGAVKELQEKVVLKYWRVFDGEDAFREIIGDYQRAHPNVKIEYRKLRYEDYEKALLEAWAEDKGPDMFSVHNTWIGKYESKIEPMPESVKLPYVTARNKKTGEVESADYKTVRMWTPFDVRDKYTETVYQDVVRNGKVVGLPLSVDTLALFYNRTMFDNAGITTIPRTWVEMKEVVKKLTLQDSEGVIVQSGVALGTGDNINRAVDILSLLMMQNGTEMVRGGVTFHKQSPYSTETGYVPGMEALRFYTDFASPSKEVYTWSNDMPEASQAFVSGKLAMMLGYSYQLPFIKTQGAKLNIGVAAAPHINADGTDATGTQINMASYWVETVSKRTENAQYAWDFLQFLNGSTEVEKYLQHTGKPTALRSLIGKQSQDQSVSVFASQVLTAKSWYRGIDALSTEKFLREAIDDVVAGKNLKEVIEYAAQRVGRTYR